MLYTAVLWKLINWLVSSVFLSHSPDERKRTSFPVSSCVLYHGQVTVEEPPAPGAAVRLAESTLVARGDAKVPRPDGKPSSSARVLGHTGLIGVAVPARAQRFCRAPLVEAHRAHAASQTMYREEEPPAQKCGGGNVT